MIRTESEYREAIRRVQQDQEVAEKQRKQLADLGLTQQEVETAMQPLLSFHAQLLEEIAWYEKVSRGQLDPNQALSNIGRLLIGLRIQNGMTQKQLAERMGVSETVVSRDENNEYHGVTLERVQRILNALGATATLTVTKTTTVNQREDGSIQKPDSHSLEQVEA